MASFDIKIKSPKKVIKNWGYELWIHNDQQYCGKLLVFPKEGSNFSMHYHMIKNETWLIQSGRFQFDWIDNTKLHRMILNVGLRIYAKYMGYEGSSESIDYLSEKLKEYSEAKKSEK